ncbi:gliding motility lipoprotein GldH [Reichenbachiella agarivorans]|uniref:Gliding motility lipoprotein GldH n=1 Tax=Reichenbachiella agarivorans TaxID=2979464 RepID=A0ABY6CRS9_9BACT|nr:gliding motility lipoprotein GldH [Reichenbachiella agarivorans]UXP33212.1 gliding motility lipoprotein GldH [Reichenbachiella agarivorans]
MKTHLILLSATIFSAFFYSCSSDTLIDKNHDITEGVWHVDSLATFHFGVEDSTQAYDISYIIRYAVGYPYYNLYVTYYLEDSTEQIIDSKLQELVLFDKKTGTPLGDGVGDLFDREVLIFENYKFNTTGDHSFKIKQFMRMEELPGILSFGLKVEKSEK